MKTKNILLTALAIATLLAACKKKDSPADPEPEPTTTTGTTPVNTDLTYSQSIGNAGTGLNEFNFNMGGNEHCWTMTTDGTFIYVGDFGNHCIKKIDLSTNTIVGWYGFQNGTWGFYTSATTPDPIFKPFRLAYYNNTIYALSGKINTSKSLVYTFNVSGAAVDTGRVINEQSFFTMAVDYNQAIYAVAGDSIRKYPLAGAIMRFGGFGSADGKLNNTGYTIQTLCSGDTLVVLDAGNDRVQKFSSSGTFISKFAVTASPTYADLCLYNTKYYLIENGKLAEYSAGGSLLKSYTIKNNPSGFGAAQKQMMVLGNKVVFQDMFNNKLHVYTK